MGDAYDTGTSLQWLRPFSPVILAARAPEDLVRRVDAAVDALMDDPEMLARYPETSPVASNTHRRASMPPAVMEGGEQGTGLKPFLEDLCVRYVREIASPAHHLAAGVDVASVQATVHAAWVIDQQASDFLPLHQHDGNLSGVLFLRVPPGLSDEPEEAGRLQFFDGRPIDPLLCPHKLLITPEPGGLYIFPSWLQHTVYPFRSAGIRRSLSFNALFYEPDGGEACG